MLSRREEGTSDPMVGGSNPLRHAIQSPPCCPEKINNLRWEPSLSAFKRL